MNVLNKPNHPPLKATRHPRHHLGIKVFLLGVVSLIVVLGVVGTVGATKIYGGATQARAALNEAQNALKETRFTDAQDELARAAEGLARARGGLTLLSFFKPFPWIGNQLRAGESLLDAGENTVSVLQSGVRIALSVTAVTGAATSDVTSFYDLPEADKAALLHALARALPDLRDMQARLALAGDDLAEIDVTSLAPELRLAIEPLQEVLPTLKLGVDVLVPLAGAASEFGGLTDDRQFLVLFLNNTELRPGGGFIGVFGLAVMRDGELKSLVTADSYAVDQFVMNNPAYPVPAPQPIKDYIGVPAWYFRDAAWSPDFAQTARDATQLMRQEVAASGQPVPEIHGVIGITPSFIARILNITGPITVDNQTFTAANITDKLEYNVEFGFSENGVPYEQRKDIVGTLSTLLTEKILSMPPSAWPILFTIAREALVEKEFALMSFDTDTQAVLGDAGWTGTISPSAADQLMVVDANLGSLKSDPAVHRSLSYSITPSPDGYVATARVTYEHTGTFDWKTTRYRTYTRLYAPLGSKLLRVEGSLLNDKLHNPALTPGPVTTADDLGMTSFGTFTSIEPGETRDLMFTYLLPATVSQAISSGTYSLDLLKQMGAQGMPLTLNLSFANKVTFGSPGELPTNFGDSVYSLNTEFDTDLSVLVRLD